MQHTYSSYVVRCFCRRFTSNSVLKSHLNTHDDARPYSCSVCNTKFSTQSSMKRHLVTHSNKRPYMCPYCHKTFKTYVNCRKHMKIHKHELAQRVSMNLIYECKTSMKIGKRILKLSYVRTAIGGTKNAGEGQATVFEPGERRYLSVTGEHHPRRGYVRGVVSTSNGAGLHAGLFRSVSEHQFGGEGKVLFVNGQRNGVDES